MRRKPTSKYWVARNLPTSIAHRIWHVRFGNSRVSYLLYLYTSIQTYSYVSLYRIRIKGYAIRNNWELTKLLLKINNNWNVAIGWTSSTCANTYVQHLEKFFFLLYTRVLRKLRYVNIIHFSTDRSALFFFVLCRPPFRVSFHQSPWNTTKSSSSV